MHSAIIQWRLITDSCGRWLTQSKTTRWITFSWRAESQPLSDRQLVDGVCWFDWIEPDCEPFFFLRGMQEQLWWFTQKVTLVRGFLWMVGCDNGRPVKLSRSLKCAASVTLCSTHPLLIIGCAKYLYIAYSMLCVVCSLHWLCRFVAVPIRSMWMGQCWSVGGVGLGIGE